MSSYCVRFAATGLPGKSPPDFTCPFPLRGMGSEQCEMERGIHLFLAHPHLGGVGGERSETEGGIHLFLAHPHLGVGGERSETEGGISAMVNDGGCPFMFDGTLSFDRVLMPASQASTATALSPPPPLRGPPPPCKRGEARFEVETRSPSPCKQGEARFWVNPPSPPSFSCPPHLGGWVASGARRKGASESRTSQKFHSTLTPPK